MSKLVSPVWQRRTAICIVAVATAATLTACAPPTAEDGDMVTITLAGPNQWTTDTDTFGTAWEGLIADFEKDNPNIRIETEVLPLSSWGTSLATQLTAGTAPELIFNQTAHTPDQVVALTDYLNEPNPFDPDNERWIDGFDSKFFGTAQQNAKADWEWIPLNLVGVGIYYNEDILDHAGIDPADLSTFKGFTEACETLKDQGVNPLGTDNGPLPTAWSLLPLRSMILNDAAEAMNVYDASGADGAADQVTAKSYARAILTGEFDVRTDPEAQAVAEVEKEWFDACATPNWSGVQSQGAFTGGVAFTGGDAAMSWGTNFSAAGLDEVDFSWSTLPFPTLEESDNNQASGNPAQFGTAAGGTSYMIPSYIEGEELEAAVTFLQYVSSPKVTDWLAASGGIPAVKGAPSPETLSALLDSDWSTSPLAGALGFNVPAANAGQEDPIVGYLIGSKSLDEFLETAQANNVAWAKEQVAAAGWTEDWAK